MNHDWSRPKGGNSAQEKKPVEIPEQERGEGGGGGVGQLISNYGPGTHSWSPEGEKQD